jgi:hypothetical protein
LTREFGPDLTWADREKRKKVLEYFVAEMNLNQNIKFGTFETKGF